MTLNNTLTEMFTNFDKSSSMMFEECRYDPDYTYKKWKSEEIVHSPIDVGYAKELEAEGISYKMLEHYGGEDMGSTYYTIWEFEKGDEVVRVKFDGWYQSYNGAEFEEWSFVEPKQKTITVWE